METNLIVEDIRLVQGQLWLSKMKEVYKVDQICPWISSFHPNKLPCKIMGKKIYRGSFNWGMKVVFSDGTAWLVRFPRGGRISQDVIDEKVAMEVTTLRLLRSQTTIPVPTVHAWGLSARNPLGTGPFIMMDFIEGKSLLDILIDQDDEHPTRLMREDISRDDVKKIYRQMANFMLQMYQIDFDRIGSLPWPENEGTSLPRPLTFKAHEIGATGGVDVFGDRTKGFETTDEYLKHLAEENWEQLRRQPNSVANRHHAEKQYRACQMIKGLVETGDFTNQKYNTGKFKLICDDLGLANLIVRSETDLTVVGVIDLEWSYAGPAQIAGSAPYWLLQDRPTNGDWDYEDGQPSRAANRYFDHLDLYLDILKEEEAKVPEYGHELSDMIQWSQKSGAMWLHMLLAVGFGHDGTQTFPFAKLRQHVGETQWARREQEFKGPMMAAFGAWKENEVRRYNGDLWEMRKSMEKVERKEMTSQEFLDWAFDMHREKGYWLPS
ncbi:uncharacterized protein N7483_003550 [Penicillium malachiteum]|uniref:uncharacterized protein n=1 Tax=Penicillium malachiteum TaxID=1324776 RepID=UPI0025495378|nr:uncharacterized protein N7483_003550 [Penicillium malachiteum]KAJ5729042.1 hypothetical protein N7483_003550 [Penicillium malachiteum]